MTDVLDGLAGIAAGSPLDALRTRRLEARENAERSFRALFHPDNPGDMPEVERHGVAAFVAGLHRDGPASAFYMAGLSRIDPVLADAVAAEARDAATTGPYGRYASAALADQNRDGMVYRVAAASRGGLGSRLASALEHAHLLVFRPREASPGALQALLDAGWTATGIVTLSQLVSFLTFQIRVAAGLRALAEASA